MLLFCELLEPLLLSPPPSPLTSFPSIPLPHLGSAPSKLCLKVPIYFLLAHFQFSEQSLLLVGLWALILSIDMVLTSLDGQNGGPKFKMYKHSGCMKNKNKTDYNNARMKLNVWIEV